MRLLHIWLSIFLGLVFVQHSNAANVSDLEESNLISYAAQQSFMDGDFAELDRISNIYRMEKSRTSSGLWKLTMFYCGIQQAIDAATEGGKAESKFHPLEKKIRKWMRQSPNSPSAHIAYGQALISHGWAYRGDGYADTVKPESWAPYKKYIAKARIELEQHKSVAASDPNWYVTMLTVSRAENWSYREFDALLNEALDKEPLFYQTYFSALQYLLPKWHGGLREVESFAQNAVKRTQQQEGSGMYARIYWYASQVQFSNEIFVKSLATWPQMRRGFDDIVRKYPDPWNLNHYAKFACLAKDKSKARQLLKQIEPIYLRDAWSPPQLRTHCMIWANRA
ncbi:hypothetical protein OYT1_ch1488 [Ferriphaselus amnicola]|uniref:Cytoplasmic protein n=1 Tax=Ferriphaselus amnicola TaxID=1188319 RepID=A0A2Z6GCD6_9PROT|nr:DUF4034 domain-containing protein [Ferriphaselus amnicola]BBE51042.1 hypothetical protein OYT1_ch1488 [Ferriphaselus amnicola]